MELTIIRDMGLVHVDGRGHDEVDVSSVPVEIHAIQWDGVTGEIEYVSNETPNENITTLPDWAEALQNAMSTRLVEEDAAEEEARVAAEAYANSPEGKAEAIRAERDRLITETDWWVVADRTPTQEQLNYRQALRDITDQASFPESVTYPTKP